MNDESAIPGAVRVEEDGLAVVHQGELIVPAAGAEAVLRAVAAGGPAVVNYYFPIELVIVGELPEEERLAIEGRIWEKLSDALQRSG